MEFIVFLHNLSYIEDVTRCRFPSYEAALIFPDNISSVYISIPPKLLRIIFFFKYLGQEFLVNFRPLQNILS